MRATKNRRRRLRLLAVLVVIVVLAAAAQSALITFSHMPDYLVLTLTLAVDVLSTALCCRPDRRPRRGDGRSATTALVGQSQK